MVVVEVVAGVLTVDPAGGVADEGVVATGEPAVGVGGRMLVGGTPKPVQRSRSSYCVPSAVFMSVSGLPFRRMTVARPSESEPPAIEILAALRVTATRWKIGSNGGSGKS